MELLNEDAVSHFDDHMEKNILNHYNLLFELSLLMGISH